MAVKILFENEGKLNCHECDDKLKEERGHDREGIVPFLVDGKRVFRCPLTFITPLSWEYIKAFGFYEKGILPNGKGWLKESDRFLEAITIIDSEFSKIKKQEESNNKK